MSATTIKMIRKMLVAVAIAATLWIAVKVFMTVGAVIMRRSPEWLTK